MWLQTDPYSLWTLDAANENTDFVWSGDFRNAIFTLTLANSFAWTVKFYGSNSLERPDFWSAASATNEYAVTEVVDYDDHETTIGSTWIVATGSSDWVYRYEINENKNRWLWIKMTARTAWDVTISLDLWDNQ